MLSRFTSAKLVQLVLGKLYTSFNISRRLRSSAAFPRKVFVIFHSLNDFEPGDQLDAYKKTTNFGSQNIEKWLSE